MEEELNANRVQPSSQASLPSEKSERGDEANRSLDNYDGLMMIFKDTSIEVYYLGQQLFWKLSGYIRNWLYSTRECLNRHAAACEVAQV